MMKGDAFTDTVHTPASPIGYYGLPVIHGPHWKWLIVGYFFCGGIAGGAAAIGAFARVFGRSELGQLSRVSTYVSFVALLPCPALLILDLGRPARFLNMLRAFRPSSPMSMGTWGACVFGLFSVTSVARQLWADRQEQGRRTMPGESKIVSDLVALGSAASGLFVAGYTGVLLAATAVPVWSKRPMLIAPLFLASAMSSGAAAIAMASALLEAREVDGIEHLQSFEAISTSVEAVLLLCWLGSLGRPGQPLEQGLLGYVVRHGIAGAGIAAPLTLSALAPFVPRRARRGITLLASALTLAGVFALRYAVVEAGRRSADDPAATFDMTG